MQTPSNTLNGLDTMQMGQTVEAIQNQPSLGFFQFRARNRWIEGGENHSQIHGFYGAGQEDDSRQEPFSFVNGEPPVLLGANEGANPVEFLLHALAGCVTTTLVVHATARGIQINSIATRLEGDIDLQGFLGLDPSVSPSYDKIRVQMEVDADCSDEALEELMAYAAAHSPVCQTIARPVSVSVDRVPVAA
jgi:uncharacterized OsmC-like protein